MAHTSTSTPSLPRVLRRSRDPNRAEIAVRARQLWERYGRPVGRDEQIWLEAERQLQGLDVRRVTYHPGGSFNPVAGATPVVQTIPQR